MKYLLLSVIPLFLAVMAAAMGGKAVRNGQLMEVTWPAGASQTGKAVLDLTPGNPLFREISLNGKRIVADVDPAFVVTVGMRDLFSQNGWNIFFDKVPNRPYETYPLTIAKTEASMKTEGSRTVVTIGPVSVETFRGKLEITFYHGSPLFNVAAVIATDADAKAIVFDAGIAGEKQPWQKVAWINTGDSLITTPVRAADDARNIAVKYRTIAATGANGTLAVFPPPHQYFYPLDEAFNLQFTWYGKNHRRTVKGSGIGIRQELQGDKRFVPWFNAPPGTSQRMNFFCLREPVQTLPWRR